MNFLRLHIFEEKKNSFQKLLKLNDIVHHEKNTTRVLEVKSRRDSVVSTECERRADWNGRRPRGTEHGRVKELRRSDNSHGSDIHLTPYTFHSDCSVRFGQWGKNPAQAEAVRSFTSFGRLSVKLRWVQADRTVQQQDGGWLVRNGSGDFDTSWLSAQRFHRK